MLNLFYITNDVNVARIAQKYGVDRIWIDLETLGKEKRQKGINSVKSNHRIEDIDKIKPILTTSKLLVRVNPWNDTSVDEINEVIDRGADIVMLPMWKSVIEVENFLRVVDKRVKTSLLLETKEAVDCIEDVLKLDFDEIHIGLNDLHLSYHLDFMFELLANGTVERLCEKFQKKGIPYGFGGIASLGKGMLPSEKIIMEHYRLGSSRAILSRSFCNVQECKDIEEVETRFKENMRPLRQYEEVCEKADTKTFNQNRLEVIESVKKIVESIKKNNETK